MGKWTSVLAPSAWPHFQSIRGEKPMPESASRVGVTQNAWGVKAGGMGARPVDRASVPPAAAVAAAEGGEGEKSAMLERGVMPDSVRAQEEDEQREEHGGPVGLSAALRPRWVEGPDRSPAGTPDGEGGLGGGVLLEPTAAPTEPP